MTKDEEFKKSVEKRFLEEVRKYRMIEPGEKIAVGLSGGRDSLTVLYLVKKFFDNDIIGIVIDEGIKGYRDKIIKNAVEFAKKWDVELKFIKFKDEVGFELDEIVNRVKTIPCSICGVIKRYLINKGARIFGADKLVTGHNLDDESQSVIMNLIQNDIQKLMRLGAVAGLFKHKKFIPRVKPLRKILKKEIEKYAVLNGINIEYKRCPYAKISFRDKIQTILNEYEKSNPRVKLNIIEVFDRLHPKIQNKFKDEKMGECKLCGEPASREICKTCFLIKKLRKRTV